MGDVTDEDLHVRFFPECDLGSVCAREGSTGKLSPLCLEGVATVALRRLGIGHEVVHGGVRNYVERFNETLKDRARPYDKYVPCSLRCDLKHVLHWTRLVVFHYNWVRPHRSRGNRPPWDTFRGAPWRRFRRAFMAALS